MAFFLVSMLNFWSVSTWNPIQNPMKFLSHLLVHKSGKLTSWGTVSSLSMFIPLFIGFQHHPIPGGFEALSLALWGLIPARGAWKGTEPRCCGATRGRAGRGGRTGRFAYGWPGENSKMDGENNGKPYEQMDDLGVFYHYFLFNTHVV